MKDKMKTNALKRIVIYWIFGIVILGVCFYGIMYFYLKAEENETLSTIEREHRYSTNVISHELKKQVDFAIELTNRENSVSYESVFNKYGIKDFENMSDGQVYITKHSFSDEGAWSFLVVKKINSENVKVYEYIDEDFLGYLKGNVGLQLSSFTLLNMQGEKIFSFGETKVLDYEKADFSNEILTRIIDDRIYSITKLAPYIKIENVFNKDEIFYLNASASIKIINSQKENFSDLFFSNIYYIILLLVLIITFVFYKFANSSVAKESTDIFNIIKSNTNDAIMITDEKRKIIYVNGAFEDITGYEESEIIGKTPRMFSTDIQTPSYYSKIDESIMDKGYFQGEIWDKRKDGVIFLSKLSIYLMYQGKKSRIKHYIGIFKDISSEVFLDSKLNSLGADTNKQLVKLIEKDIEKNGNAMFPIVVLKVLDLDRLYARNDRNLIYRKLDQISVVVKNELGVNDTFAIIKRGEFAIILRDLLSKDEIVHFLRKMIEEDGRFRLIDQDIAVIKLKIGIAFYGKESKDINTVIDHAYLALDQAKQIENNSYAFYSKELHDIVNGKRKLEQDLIKAVKNNMFEIVYHPQVDLNSNKVIGAEALIRIDNKEYEHVSPGQYIPMAEKTGIIIPLSNWIFEKVCSQIATWKKKGLIDFRISMNVSPMHFYKEDFVASIMNLVKLTAIRYEDIELEMTENVLVRDFEMVNGKMQQLRNLGVRLTIDDFGTGYASLKYIKNLKIDKIKIDRTFIKDYPTKDDGEIAKAISMFAKAKGIKVILEGVEDEKQLVYAKSIGCEVIQGFYFSKPLSKNDFEKYVVKMNNLKRKER